jgi:transcriptional regulator with XRE-family HTH domain
MDFGRLARELVRALRGSRSQAALSRRLKCRSNVIYAWESGSAFPSAARALTLARLVGVEPAIALERFYRRRPDWLTEFDPASRVGVARLLQDLKGRQPTVQIAARMGHNRYAVGRWLKGETEPRLPEFLALVEACSLRVLDFLAALVSLEALPALAREGQQLAAARRIAREAPWSHAVLRALELEAYAALPAHQPGWIAERIGLSAAEEERCLTLLESAGQISWQKDRWATQSVSTLDLRQDHEATLSLATWCATLGTERLVSQGQGQFAFNVFAVSDEDAERLSELQRQYFAQLRSVIVDSRPARRVLVTNPQLFELGVRSNASG